MCKSVWKWSSTCTDSWMSIGLFAYIRKLHWAIAHPLTRIRATRADSGFCRVTPGVCIGIGIVGLTESPARVYRCDPIQALRSFFYSRIHVRRVCSLGEQLSGT